MRQLWADYRRHAARKEEIAEQMATLYRELREKGKAPDRIGKLDEATMGRIIAETGPVGDFDHGREIQHYGGLNLYERKSGKYRGETRISKKGRSRLRKVLGQVAYTLIRGDGLFADYYERRRAEGKGHWKTIVAIMRKLCMILYGLYKSGRPFDPERAFTCESQYVAGT